MLKISIVEGRKQRRLVVEGRFVAPWSDELKAACERAGSGLGTLLGKTHDHKECDRGDSAPSERPWRLFPNDSSEKAHSPEQFRPARRAATSAGAGRPGPLCLRDVGSGRLFRKGMFAVARLFSAGST